MIAARCVGRHARGGLGERAQLLPRPRHRRADDAHQQAVRSIARPSRRATRWCSGWCSGVVSAASVRDARRTPLRAVLAVAAIAFYVGVYTAVLKRRTSANIVWGGAAGCMPVLIGWAAVRDCIGWAPVVLFLVVFLWTPPHFWALAMRYRDDYARAGVPMLPVVATEAAGRRPDRLATRGRWSRRRSRCGRSRTRPLVYPVAAARRSARRSSARRTRCAPGRTRASRRSRCGCSTGRSRTCRRCSSRSPSTRSSRGLALARRQARARRSLGSRARRGTRATRPGPDRRRRSAARRGGRAGAGAAVIVQQPPPEPTCRARRTAATRTRRPRRASRPSSARRHSIQLATAHRARPASSVACSLIAVRDHHCVGTRGRAGSSELTWARRASGAWCRGRCGARPRARCAASRARPASPRRRR